MVAEACKDGEVFEEEENEEDEEVEEAQEEKGEVVEGILSS